MGAQINPLILMTQAGESQGALQLLQSSSPVQRQLLEVVVAQGWQAAGQIVLRY